MTEAYVCETCGSGHGGMPEAFFVDAPAVWDDPRRGPDSLLDEETAVVDLPDGRRHLVRAHLEVPVVDSDAGPLSLTLWVLVAPESLRSLVARWQAPDRASDPPVLGVLGSVLPVWPRSYGLRCRLHVTPPGQRPRVELAPTADALAVDAREGITTHRMAEVVAALTGAPVG